MRIICKWWELDLLFRRDQENIERVREIWGLVNSHYKNMDLGEDFMDLNKIIEILGGFLRYEINFSLHALVYIYVNIWIIIERGGSAIYAHIVNQ